MKARPPPRAKTPSVTIYLDDSDSQISFADSFYADPKEVLDCEGFFIAQPNPEFNGNMESVPHSLIPLQGTELLKEGDLECNDFGESNKVMNVPLYRLLKSGKWKVKSEKEKNKWFIVSLFIQ